jgi:hypothetical protein
MPPRSEPWRRQGPEKHGARSGPLECLRSVAPEEQVIPGLMQIDLVRYSVLVYTGEQGIRILFAAWAATEETGGLSHIANGMAV